MGTDCEVGCGEWAIAFAAIVGRLAGTSVTAIEQPLTESDAVGAGAIGEEAIVAEALWRSRLGLGWRRRAEGGLFARATGARELCVAIVSISRVGTGGIPGGRD